MMKQKKNETNDGDEADDEDDVELKWWVFLKKYIFCLKEKLP